MELKITELENEKFSLQIKGDAGESNTPDLSSIGLLLAIAEWLEANERKILNN